MLQATWEATSEIGAESESIMLYLSTVRQRLEGIALEGQEGKRERGESEGEDEGKQREEQGQES